MGSTKKRKYLVNLAFHYSRHFATPPLVCLKNERRNSTLITRYYPDLGIASNWSKQNFHAARQIRSASQIWVVTRDQYGISALVPNTLFGGEPSGDIAKCGLFSQANHTTCLPTKTSHKKFLVFWVFFKINCIYCVAFQFRITLSSINSFLLWVTVLSDSAIGGPVDALNIHFSLTIYLLTHIGVQTFGNLPINKV